MKAAALAPPKRLRPVPRFVRAIRCWIRRSLFRKLFLAFLVLVSGGLLTNSLVDLAFSYQSNQAALKRLQTKEAVGAASGIKQFVDEIEAQIAGVVRPIRAIGAADLEQRQEAYSTLLRLAPAISQVTYLDGAGNRLLKLSRVAISEGAGPTDIYEDEAAQQTAPDLPYRSEVYFRDESEPHLRIGIRDRGPNSGVTVAEVNLTFIRDVISRIQVGRAGVAYVVDREGRLIAYPDISPVLQQVSPRNLPQVATALSSELAEPSAGEPVVGRSLDGREVVSYYQTVEPLSWLIFVEWPLAEARQPIYEAALRTALLLAVGLTVSALASLLVTRRLVAPIGALQRAAASIDPALDRRALERRIEVSTGDELEALAREFNRMTARLQESYESLEQQVKDRTRDLSEALKRQTAISEVLRLITGSPTDRQAVLDVVAENAARLCEASGASIWLRDGDMLRRTAGYGLFASEVGAERAINRASITGRAAADAKTVHEPDLEALDETEYPESERRQHGHRSALSTPIMGEGEVAGVLSIGREQAERFSEPQIELLKAFADQIVIALELTRLFREIHDKSRQLEAAGEQLDEVNRRLQRFLSPQVAGLIASGADLETHPAEITVVFCDLRGYTAFADTTQPQYVIRFMQEYQKELGLLIQKYGGTLERFTGDGLMVFFNDPVPCPNSEELAVRMALDMRGCMQRVIERWRHKRSHHLGLGFGVGIDQGYAMVGRIGFEGRYDYAAIGPVTNCAARVCSEAGDGDVLITQPVSAAVEDLVEVEPKGDLELKGFHQPVRVYNVLGLKQEIREC